MSDNGFNKTTFHRPYNDRYFVGRDKELRLIDAEVRRRRTDGRGVVINFWGVEGSGKTWLLNHIHHRYGRQQRILTLFHTLQPEGVDAFQAVSLAQNIAHQLGQLALDRIKEPSKHQTILKATSTGRLSTLTATLKETSQHFVPLLILDNTDRLSEEAWHELEDEIVSPLISQTEGMVVIAGRREPPWQRFEVRRRLLDLAQTQLDNFSIEELAELARRHDYPISEDYLNDLLFFTAGNPYLAEVLIHLTRQSNTGLELLRSQAPSDLKREFAQLIEAYEASLLRKLSAKAQETIAIVAPLRSYRIDALRYMYEKQTEIPLSDADVEISRQLQRIDRETDLVRWNRTYRAYTTDITLRRVINLKRYLASSEQYVKSHKDALAMYWELARRYATTCEAYILEIWFHVAQIYRAQVEQFDLQQEIDKAFGYAQEHLRHDAFLILPQQLDTDTELLESLPLPTRTVLRQKLEEATNGKS